MGAWDETAFGNDDAADWSFDLMEADDSTAFLEEALDLADNEGYLEAPEGSVAVAAACVVAAACGRTPNGLPEELNGWLADKIDSIKPLAGRARAAVTRVRTAPSELLELWKEGEDFAAWDADLESIGAALID